MASRPIDERIVVMRLENGQFKTKAAETVGIFGKLKQALGNVGNTRLDKVSNEIQDIERASNKVSLSNMISAVDAISSRFSTLGVVATTALMNITNKAVDASMALAKNLTVDQVSDGFREYETKIGSIGTVLSNTEWAGTSLDDVKRVLEELNVYADNTVYSFGQMTENIGRFTAAGVTIDDSATAIKGLSNLAAASGSDVNQLNTAMYQMSQSMAAGTFNLMDWNSLVNAGMGGKKTQDALLETAKAMGVNVDMSEGFRNSISKGWLSAEVFLETMKKFGNDESMTEAATAVRTFTGMMDSLKEGIGSGWATTWEIIFGDFEQATVFWTALSTAVTGFFSKQSESRNTMLQNLVNGGALEDFGLGIRNSLIPIGQLLKAVGDGFAKAFPPKTTAQLKSMTEGFKNFTEKLKMSDSTLAKVTTVFQGAFAVISSGIEIVKLVGKAFLNLIPKSAGSSFLDILVKFAEFSIAVNKSLKDGNAFTRFIETIGSGFKVIGSVVGSVITTLVSFSGTLLGNVGNAIGWIADKLAPLGQLIKESFSGVGGEDILGVGMVAALFLVIKKITSAFDVFGDVFDGIKDLFKNSSGMFESLGDTLNAFATGVKLANLVLIAGAITMMAVSLKMLEGIDSEDLSRGLVALGVSLALMMGALAVISKFNLVGGLKASVTLVAIATATTIMAVALKTVSDLNPEELKSGISGLVTITGALVVALIAISKFGGKIATSSLSLIALATSIYILANAVDELSKIDGKDLGKSVLALGVIFAQLAVFLKVVSGAKLSVSSALGVIAIAGALQIMVDAIQKIAKINAVDLAKGLGTIAILLAEIAVFSLFAGGPNMLMAGAGILLIAGAINALVPAIQALGGMTWEELAKGLGGMAVALAAVAAAGILATGAIGGAVAITVMAAALNLLVGPIERFANLTWGEIIKGLTSVALALGLLAGASMLLTPVIPVMLALGGALLVMGAAMLAAGAGIALFGTGLATLATLTAGSIAAIVAGLALLLKSFAELIPGAIDFVVKVGMALLDGFQSLVPKLLTVVVELVMSILRTLDKNLPEFIEVGVSIVVKLIEGIADALPKLVTAALDLIVTLIKTLAGAIRDNGPQIISAVWELVASILILMIEAGGQVINSLFGWIPGVSDAVSSIGGAAEKYLMDSFGADIIGADKGKDFSSSLSGTSGQAKTAGEAIAKAGKEGASGIDMTDTGENFATGFANGIGSSSVISNVISKAKSLASSAYNAITGALDMHSPSRETEILGEYTGQGFANGIGSKTKSVAEAVFGWLPGMKKSTSAITSSAASSGEKVGTSAVTGIGKGISKTAPKVAKKAKKSAKDTAKDVAKTAMDAFKDKMDDLEYKFEMGEIDHTKHLEGIQKLKDSYKKYPDIVKEASRAIKKVEEDRAKFIIDQENKVHNKRKDLIADRKYYSDLTLKQELEAWERIQAKHDEGTDKRKEADKEVYRLKNEMAQATFEDSKYYNELTLREELGYWYEQQNMYKEGTEKRKAAEKEVYRLKNELAASYLSDRKFYNDMSLRQEISYWEIEMRTHKEGTEKRKEAERQIYTLKNELNQKLIGLNEEYLGKVQETNQKLIDDELAVNKKYEESVTSRANALTSFAGLFDELTKASEVTGQQLMDNLRSQVDGLASWADDIRRLSERGIDEGLLEELRQMGPKAHGEIAALNTMTDSDLTRYSEIWREKNAIARSLAIEELQGLRKETDGEIEKLRKDSKDQLETYKNEWVGKIKEINDGTKNQFVGLNTSMQTIGTNAIKGLMTGLSEMKGPLMREASEIANSVSTTISKALKIKSPSRVTMAQGEFAGEGLAIGLHNMAGKVAKGAKTLANTAKSTLNDMLDGFGLSDYNSELHFKAVVDYDGIDKNMLNMNSMSIAAPDTSFGYGLMSSISPGNQTRTLDPLGNGMLDKLGNKISSTIAKAMEATKLPTLEINSPIYMDGREVAKVTHKHITELQNQGARQVQRMRGKG